LSHGKEKVTEGCLRNEPVATAMEQSMGFGSTNFMARCHYAGGG
jgi:hypothetical protein